MGRHARPRRPGLIANSMAIIVSSGLTAVLGYAFWTLAARAASAQQVGAASTVVPGMSVVALVVAAGLVPQLTQALPGTPPARFQALASTALCGAALAGALGGVVLTLTLPRSAGALVGTGLLLPLLVVGAAATAAGLVLDAVFLGARRATMSLARNAVASLARLVPAGVLLAVSALAGGRGGVGSARVILILWTCSLALSLAYAARLMRKVAPGFRLRPAAWALPRLGRRMGWQHLASLGGQLPAFALPVVAAARLPAEQAGYLYLTWMVGSAFFMVSPAVSAALLADCAEAPERLRVQLRRSLAFTAAILAAPATLVCLLAGQVLDLFGPAYARHGQVLLVLLVASSVPDAITNVAVTVLRLRRRYASTAVLNVGMAVATLAGAWLTLPQLGIVGAGWCWLAAQTAGALAVLAVLAARRRTRPAVARDRDVPSAPTVATTTARPPAAVAVAGGRGPSAFDAKDTAA